MTYFLEILKKNDHQFEIEEPENFDYFGNLKKVKSIEFKLASQLNESFHLDSSVQDATFFAQLSILKKSKGENRNDYWEVVFSLRFSSFGNLATFTNHEYLGQEDVGHVIELLNKEGFIYVPKEELKRIYDGRNRSFQGETWFLRFFDFI